MKKAAAIFIFTIALLQGYANGTYRWYLLSRVNEHRAFSMNRVLSTPSANDNLIIPHYERPKGSVFCRMEDKVTKLTGVWLKVGVQ